jgi:hypothetical protein
VVEAEELLEEVVELEVTENQKQQVLLGQQVL